MQRSTEWRWIHLQRSSNGSRSPLRGKSVEDPIQLAQQFVAVRESVSPKNLKIAPMILGCEECLNYVLKKKRNVIKYG